LNLRRVRAQHATGLRRAGSFLGQVELEAVLLGGRDMEPLSLSRGQIERVGDEVDPSGDGVLWPVMS
jgi:hypothetical protein